ncbi:MAG: hypothetical protein IPO63_15420 [Bacteroidetes bacterium]|nr:hypothetical protein [Bacteroidota bacterium]
MATNIRIPIALEKETNKLVHVIDVKNGKECNCYCPNCKADLVAVNRRVKQSAHFRHDIESNCVLSLSFESYIHWLSKEIFKTIDIIKLPPITFHHFDTNPYQNPIIINKLNEYLEYAGINARFHAKNFNLLGRVFQEPTEIRIESCFIEREYQTTLGDIRVDIVLLIEGKELFVEPFFSNPIKSDKLQKIAALDISTVSIDLRSFLKLHEHDFTIDSLKEFMINSIVEKGWVYIRRDKVTKFMDKLFNNNFHSKLKKLKSAIERNEELNREIEVYDKEISELLYKRTQFERELVSINYYDLFDKRNSE